MGNSPPRSAMGTAGALMPYRQAAPAWASGTSRSATVTDAWRLTGPAVAAIRNATLPSPCPSTLEVKVIQSTGVVARQTHSRATATDSVPAPPAEVNVEGGAEMVASHRADVGVVMFVAIETELPHPRAVPAALVTTAANSRGVR